MAFDIVFYGALAVCGALFVYNVLQMAGFIISDSRDGRRRERESRAWLAMGLAPRNVEEIAMLEGRALVGWTSDSAESFLAAYEARPGDLDGLGSPGLSLTSGWRRQ